VRRGPSIPGKVSRRLSKGRQQGVGNAYLEKMGKASGKLERHVGKLESELSATFRSLETEFSGSPQLRESFLQGPERSRTVSGHEERFPSWGESIVTLTLTPTARPWAQGSATRERKRKPEPGARTLTLGGRVPALASRRAVRVAGGVAHGVASARPIHEANPTFFLLPFLLPFFGRSLPLSPSLYTSAPLHTHTQAGS
jgi:hypothetical protein